MHSKSLNCKRLPSFWQGVLLPFTHAQMMSCFKPCMKISSDLVAVRQWYSTYSDDVHVLVFYLRVTYFIRPLWISMTTSNIWRAQNHSGLTHQRATKLPVLFQPQVMYTIPDTFTYTYDRTRYVWYLTLIVADILWWVKYLKFRTNLTFCSMYLVRYLIYWLYLAFYGIVLM